MISSTQTQLDHSRRKLVRDTALALLVGCATTMLVVVILFILAPYQNLLLLGLGVMVVVTAGVGLTLYMLPRSQLGRSVIPMAIVLIVGVVALSLALPETTMTSVPLLAIVVLLTSLSRNRNATISIGLACIIVGGALASRAPGALQVATQFGAALPVVYAIGVSTLIAVIWLIGARLNSTAETALDEAEKRALDAEHARRETETARISLQERTDDQQRLLNLVSVLETPTIQLDNHVLLAPIVGHIDSQRIERISQHLLETVHRGRIALVILDIAGVPILDDAVANALLATARALRLLGCDVQVSGVTAQTALDLCRMQISLDEITSVRNFHEALSSYRS